MEAETEREGEEPGLTCWKPASSFASPSFYGSSKPSWKIPGSLERTAKRLLERRRGEGGLTERAGKPLEGAAPALPLLLSQAGRGRSSLHHLEVGVPTGRSATPPPLTANLVDTLLIPGQDSEVQPFSDLFKKRAK